MTRLLHGLRSVLANSLAYGALQDLLGGPGPRRRFLDTWVRARPGQRFLDLGCGPGTIVGLLPQGVDYVGVDLSEAYIRAARRRHGHRGRFITADVTEPAWRREAGRFDLVLAKGLLHHLADDAVVSLCRAVEELLDPGGRFVTFDGCFAAGQSRLARALLRADRGRYVRTPEGYLALVGQVFPAVESHVLHDLLRVPYTHLVLECSARGDP